MRCFASKDVHRAHWATCSESSDAAPRSPPRCARRWRSVTPNRILGHLLGFKGKLESVIVESLVPEEYRDLTTSEFVRRLEELDPVWRERVDDARARDSVLRYRATAGRESVRVGLVAVNAASSLGALMGTDNQFSITTSRYRDNPIVITGPGAGVAVTAAGVLNDVLKLAGSR